MARTVCCDKVEPGEAFDLLRRRWNLRLDCQYDSHGPHAIAREEFDSGLFQIRGRVHLFILPGCRLRIRGCRQANAQSHVSVFSAGLETGHITNDPFVKLVSAPGVRMGANSRRKR